MAGLHCGISPNETVSFPLICSTSIEIEMWELGKFILISLLLRNI